MIRPFCIMLLYRFLLHYGLLLHIMLQYLCLFSLILQGLHKEGECRQLRFWAGKGANIRDIFCTAPKVLKTPRKTFSKYIKNTESKNFTRGATPCPWGWGARPTRMGAPPTSWPPWWPSGDHLLLYEVFRWEKNNKRPSRTKLRRHEAEPWRNQSRALAELFCWGNFPPGGGNQRHRHHQRSSHRERAIYINIFINIISSQNPSSSLVSNSCLQVRYWY